MMEDRLHAQMYMWFHNKFPEHRGTLCYNHNNSKNKIEGNRNRTLGIQKGRSDFTFNFRGISYKIEVKTETGKQSKDQKEWQQLMELHGFKYYIVRSLKEFQQLINHLMKKVG